MGFRVWGLESKLLGGGVIGDYVGFAGFRVPLRGGLYREVY